MKELSHYLFVCLFIFLYTTDASSSPSQEADMIVISGKIFNYDKDSEYNAVTVYVRDHAITTSLNYSSKVDDEGNFKINFTHYHTTDIFLAYRTNIRVLVHPGDSLHIEFDGSTDSRVEILESARFTGAAAKVNADLAKYQSHYFAHSPSFDFINNKIKSLSPRAYQTFEDSLRKEQLKARSYFIEELNPSEEFKKWTYWDIQYGYYDRLMAYPLKKFGEKGIPNNYWEGHEDFWTFINNMPKLDEDALANSELKPLINKYFNFYLFQYSLKKEDWEKKRHLDSVRLSRIPNMIPEGGLLRSLSLAAYFSADIKRYDFEMTEKVGVDSLKKLIPQAYLHGPLITYYQDKKTQTTKPLPASTLLNKMQDKDAQKVLTELLANTKGKVVYIDCWTVTCRPCIAQFPYSKKLKASYEGKDVSFVYFCFNSDEPTWERIIKAHELKGKHYFFDRSQSAAIQSTFKIGSYPTYIILDKEGNIVRNGNSMRPGSTKTKEMIDRLLDI